MSEPKPPPDGANKPPPPDEGAEVQPKKALEELRKRELPSNDWPGKGAA